MAKTNKIKTEKLTKHDYAWIRVRKGTWKRLKIVKAKLEMNMFDDLVNYALDKVNLD